MKERGLADNKETLMVRTGRQRPHTRREKQNWEGGERRKELPIMDSLGFVGKDFCGVGESGEFMKFQLLSLPSHSSRCA